MKNNIQYTEYRICDTARKIETQNRGRIQPYVRQNKQYGIE